MPTPKEKLQEQVKKLRKVTTRANGETTPGETPQEPKEKQAS